MVALGEQRGGEHRGEAREDEAGTRPGIRAIADVEDPADHQEETGQSPDPGEGMTLVLTHPVILAEMQVEAGLAAEDGGEGDEGQRGEQQRKDHPGRMPGVLARGVPGGGFVAVDTAGGDHGVGFHDEELPGRTHTPGKADSRGGDTLPETLEPARFASGADGVATEEGDVFRGVVEGAGSAGDPERIRGGCPVGNRWGGANAYHVKTVGALEVFSYSVKPGVMGSGWTGQKLGNECFEPQSVESIPSPGGDVNSGFCHSADRGQTGASP
jgi:hypothetical protein